MSRSGHRLVQLLAAAALVVASAWVPSASAGARPVSPSAGAPGGVVAPGGAPSVTLLGQSPFVESGQRLHLQLQLAVPDPADRLQVVLGPRLTTRSGFDADVRYGARSSSVGVYSSPASSLPPDPAGGVDVEIPVNPTTPGGSNTFTVQRDVSGVYPLTVELVTAGSQQVGTPITTFLVYASPSAAASATPGGPSNGLPPLDVALNVPVSAPVSPDGNGRPRLAPTASSALAAEVAALTAHAGVPLTLDASPATLDGLLGGGATDRATLAQLQALTATDQVAEQPYAPVSLPSLTAAGLGGEIAAQLRAGTATVAADLGHPPTAGTLAVDGPLDQATAGDLVSNGIGQMVVPSADLSALPASESQTTVASPATLDIRGAASAKVVNVDEGLQADFSGGASAALRANRLLAELAMIQLETPGEHRGVALVPPSGWRSDPAFLSTLLAGLSANPLLRPVPTSSLFALPMLGGASGLTRTLNADRPTVAGFPTPGVVRSARQAVSAAAAILPPSKGQVTSLQRQLLLAESAQLPPSTQRRQVAAVAGSLSRLRRSISLPSTSVTLTARDGDVPITVVAASGLTGARVQLRLTSEKLAFRPFSPPGGSCSAPTSGVEECQLVLTGEATTLKVPVVARASGVFTFSVALSSPDGAVAISQSRDTVRSTAFSGVGVILMVVAGLGLLYWWIRNLRHGRRAKELVPPSDELDDPVEAGDDDGGSDHRHGDGDHRDGNGGGDRGDGDGHHPGRDSSTGDGDSPSDDASPSAEDTSWLDDDPVIAQFFSSPAPSYPPRRNPPPS